MAVNLANGYAIDISGRNDRHEKKAPGRPLTHKDTNLSDTFLSSDDDSDSASTIQAQVVHKMTRATSSNLTQITTRARSTTVTKRKALAKKAKTTIQTSKKKSMRKN